MSFSKISAISGLVALASKAAAHGVVTGIVADGIYYEGYHADFQYMSDPPVVVGWSIPEDLSNGFIAPDAYATGDIICHLNATNAGTSAPVKAGGIVELQWTAWPSSHHGPVIDYLANCGGDCTTVDKTTLEWFKIDAQGLYNDTNIPGSWASDTLIANNNSWSVTIPTDIAPGNYVLRHEIIALHSAGESDGAQNYPQCVNLEISGTGTATPSGTLGTALYSETDPGILIDIYTSLSTYDIPGPTLYSGAISMSETQQPSATAVGTGVNSVATDVVAATTAASSAAQITSAAVSSAQGTSVAASSAAQVTSSAQAAVVASSAAVQVTSAISVASVAPYSNGTASSSKSVCKKSSTASSSKSVCKKKSSSTSVLVATSINVTIAQTSSALFTTFADSVTIATTLTPIVSTTAVAEAAATTAASSSSPTSVSTSSDDVTEPTGTTLGDLLSWLSSFYSSHSGTTYTDSTLARRHAKDIAARDFDKFADVKEHATGTVSGGAHPTHHHYKPSGTGSFGKGEGGFAQQTGKGGFGGFGGFGSAEPTGHGGKGGKEHAKPTGSFPASAGRARPTGSFKAAGSWF